MDSPVHDVSSATLGDSGEYTVAFTHNGISYRSAPIRVVVGTDPLLSPTDTLLTVAQNRPLNIAFDLDGNPFPNLFQYWMTPIPDGVAWSNATATLSGTPSAEGRSAMWIYAENNSSRYSGNPLSRVYTLDVVYRNVESVSLNKENTTIQVGGAETLYATVQPQLAANHAVEWQSSNSDVAVVLPGGKSTYHSLGGTVLGLSPGTAVVTATTVDGQKIDGCMVSILAEPVPVTGVTLDRNALSMRVGDTAQLKATISPQNATNQNLEWASTNPGIAAAGADGYVTALSPGSTIIRATTEDGGLSAACSVTVTSAHIPVRAILINKSSTGLLVGTSETLYATVLPENATNKSVRWSVTDEDIASLSQSPHSLRMSSGTVVTGVAPGEAIVTATAVDGGLTADCRVTVSATPIPVAGIELDKSRIEIDAGESERLQATVLPTNATNQNLRWLSDDPEVASVDDDGWLAGIAPGSTVVAVETAGGDFRASCDVIVSDLPELSLHSIGGESHPCGVFTIAFRVETRDGNAFPSERVIRTEANFQPDAAARQLLWRLERESGENILYITGRFLSGTAQSTSLRKIVFEFDNAKQRYVAFSPAPSLAELLNQYYSSGSGCAGGTVALVPAVLLVVLKGANRRKKIKDRGAPPHER